MQIPGLNLLHVPSLVVAPTESPAVSDGQRTSIDTSSPVLASDAQELRETPNPLESHRSPLQEDFLDAVEQDNRETTQTDTFSVTAMQAAPDPLDLALADQSSDTSGNEDAEAESTSNDRYYLSSMQH